VDADAADGAVLRRADEALTSDRNEANDVNNMKTTDATPFGGHDLAKEDGNCPRVQQLLSPRCRLVRPILPSLLSSVLTSVLTTNIFLLLLRLPAAAVNAAANAVAKPPRLRHDRAPLADDWCVRPSLTRV
jgi:hypothetical protein